MSVIAVDYLFYGMICVLMSQFVARASVCVCVCHVTEWNAALHASDLHW